MFGPGSFFHSVLLAVGVGMWMPLSLLLVFLDFRYYYSSNRGRHNTKKKTVSYGTKQVLW